MISSETSDETEKLTLDEIISAAQGGDDCFCCGTANAEDDAETAKAQIAEAIQKIIGEDAEPPEDNLADAIMFLQRESLRMEQLERLSEFLGSNIES